jgi:hypothetical protein
VKVSVRTGRVLSRDVIHSHNQLKKELTRFQATAEYEVRLTAINPEFYELFRNYALGSTERSPRTFNGYLKQLRQFLFWCEEQEVPVSPRFRRVLRLVPGYVGVEALNGELSPYLSLACLVATPAPPLLYLPHPNTQPPRLIIK